MEGNRNTNIIFIGHVDSGKSTISGQILQLTNQIDKRLIEKYKKEAEEIGRKNWYLSWILDINPKEREKGITIECGKAQFKTKKNYTIIDSPGHICFIKNMIFGLMQANITILVISAKPNEFHAGLKGSTFEHTILTKMIGSQNLIVLINKMDDQLINWSKDKFNDYKKIINIFLQKIGYRKTVFIPVSGIYGTNIMEVTPSWYKGPSLLEYLDSLPISEDSSEIIIIVIEKNKESVLCIIISGIVKCCELSILPSNQNIKLNMDKEYYAGSNIILSENLHIGDILFSGNCFQTKKFIAQILLFDCLLTAEFKCIFHIHISVINAKISKIKYLIQKEGESHKRKPTLYLKKDQVGVVEIELEDFVIVNLNFAKFNKFVLRLNNNTIAFGKILQCSS